MSTLSAEKLTQIVALLREENKRLMHELNVARGWHQVECPRCNATHSNLCFSGCGGTGKKWVRQ